MDQPETPNPNHDPERQAEEARRLAANDPEFADTDATEHDPYAHLRPHQFKPGQSGNPAGRPPGIRSLAKRMRQAGTLRPADIDAFKALASKLGIDEPTLKGMDIIDLLSVSTFLHAISGKSAALAQVTRTLTGSVLYTPNDSKDKKPDDYRNDAIQFYEAVIASPDIDIKDKIIARGKLDAIQGLLNDTSTMGAEQMADEIRDFLEMAESSVPKSPNDDEEQTSPPLSVQDNESPTQVDTL